MHFMKRNATQKQKFVVQILTMQQIAMAKHASTAIQEAKDIGVRQRLPNPRTRW